MFLYMKMNEHYHYQGMTASECLAKAKECERESAYLLSEAARGDDRELRHEDPLPSNLDEIRWDLDKSAERLREAAKRLEARDKKRLEQLSTVKA